MGIVEDMNVRPREEEILRLLRRGKGEKDPGAWTAGLVREALRDAEELARPRAIYDFVNRESIPDHRVFASATRVALCICTIGPELEACVSDRMKRGELARGVVLDAVGSEMAEAAARVLDERIEKEEACEGHRAGARFSPGYGEWGLEGQRWVFDVLDAARIGVTLSPTMMMRPRKSVSFAVNFGPDPIPPRCVQPCDSCEMKDCAFRREQST